MASPVLNRTVLLVEDNPLLNLALQAWLEDAGARVVSAVSLGELRRVLSTTSARPDLMVTDLNLPDGTGREAIRDVRSVHGGVPTVVLSGDACDDLADASTFVLRKPVDPGELMPRIGEALLRDGPKSA